MAAGTVRTTITLPADLVDEVDRIVREGHARSRNELFLTALRHELAARERAEIDAQFEALADDKEAQAEALIIAEESAAGSWEALLIAESEA
jgi:metal-responsive CopG/Arc/MetJ family transcriptional regulator